MNILSVSRRTDIPCFYAGWFNQRLKQGFAEYVHPFTKKTFKVSLSKEDVIGLVFWSKNFQPFLKTIQKIKKDYRFYCHFTVNGYSAELEKQTIDLNKRIDTFKKLADLSSPKQTILRYDPLILSKNTAKAYHLKTFKKIASALSSYTERCFLSFVSLYKKTTANLAKEKIIMEEEDINTKLSLTKSLLEIAKTYNIKLYSCCNDYLLLSGINKGHCIDTEIFRSIYPDFAYHIPYAPTRKECGCVKSLDIGKYNSCPNGCLYCYANLNQKLALQTYKEHNPESTFL